MRHDGGDAETGFGLDLGGGLALSDPKRGLQAELRGRGLLTHESKGFRDLGFSGSLAWEGNPGSDRGREAEADPDGRRVVLGRRRCAARAHHAGRAGGERRRRGRQ